MTSIPSSSSFIHSGHFYSAPSSPQLLGGAPDYSTDTVGKGFAQGLYMAARAGVDPMTLRLKAINSTKAPPCPVIWHHHTKAPPCSSYGFCYVMLCYMVICKAPLTGVYSEALSA